MIDSLAREEADRYFSNQDRITAHPEDTENSDHSDMEENTVTAVYHSDPGDDDETLYSLPPTSTTTYHLPRTVFEANTGPKGVIADAQSFDRAKKQSLRHTFMNIASGSYFQPTTQSGSPSPPRLGSPSVDKAATGYDEDEDDGFMQRWRRSRLKELSTGGWQGHQRRQSPSKRKWGFFNEVDGNGYLDAVEKTGPDTVVVVCIYDPHSDESTAVEDALHNLSQKHATTRFVKLHHEIAELENVDVPAIIAYQRGDVIAMLTDCSAVGLETNLRRNGILVDSTS